MILKRLTIKGLKIFKEEIEIEFNREFTQIIGHNAKGKSSIFDAIVWVFTGYTRNGGKNIAELFNDKDSDKIEVSVQFESKDKEYVLLKSLAKTGNRVLKLNGKSIKQKELDEIIDSKAFLTITNPLYYFSLQPQEARENLISLLPIITIEEVLLHMNEKQKEVLKKISLDKDLNIVLTDKRSQIKNLEDESKEKVIKELEESLKEVSLHVELDVKTSDRIKELKQRELDFLTKRAPIQDTKEYELEKKELEFDIQKVQEQKFDDTKLNDYKNKLNMEQSNLQIEESKLYEDIIDEKHGSLYNIKVKVNSLRIINSKYKDDITNISKRIQTLKNNKRLFAKGQQCPYCSSVLNDDSTVYINKKMANDIIEEELALKKESDGFQAELDKLNLEGNELLKALANVREMNEKNLKEFNGKKEERKKKLLLKIKELEQFIKVETDLAEKFNNDKKQKLISLEEKRNTLKLYEIEKENKKVEQKFEVRRNKALKKLRKELALLQEEESNVLKHNQNIEIIKKDNSSTNKKIKDYKEIEEKNKAEINQLKSEVEAIKQYQMKKIGLLKAIIKQYLHNADIRLIKINSEGNTYDVFEILYNNIILSMCSNSENIKAGLEISHMFSKLKELNYPIIIDNAESICEYDRINRQVIELSVAKGKELSVIINQEEKRIINNEPIEIRKGLHEMVALTTE